MQYDVSHFLREPVGCQWEVGVDEVVSAEPVKGERIRGQLPLTRLDHGVWAEARLSTRAVQFCGRCLRSFRQPVRAEFAELYRTGEPGMNDLELRVQYVDNEGVLDLGDLFRQHLILNLPAKLLCHPQYVGICPSCGAYGDNHDHYHNHRSQGQELSADSRWNTLAVLGSSGGRGR
jgi:uncharacterized protein